MLELVRYFQACFGYSLLWNTGRLHCLWKSKSGPSLPNKVRATLSKSSIRHSGASPLTNTVFWSGSLLSFINRPKFPVPFNLSRSCGSNELSHVKNGRVKREISWFVGRFGPVFRRPKNNKPGLCPPEAEIHKN